MTYHESLRAGLLRTAEYRELYERSASFRHSVDGLAALLPSWVDGLAANARHTDKAMDAYRAALSAGIIAVDPETVLGMARDAGVDMTPEAAETLLARIRLRDIDGILSAGGPPD